MRFKKKCNFVNFTCCIIVILAIFSLFCWQTCLKRNFTLLALLNINLLIAAKMPTMYFCTICYYNNAPTHILLLSLNVLPETSTEAMFQLSCSPDTFFLFPEMKITTYYHLFTSIDEIKCPQRAKRFQIEIQKCFGDRESVEITV